MSSRYSAFEIEAPLSPQSPEHKVTAMSKISRIIAASLMCVFCIVNIVLLLLILTNHAFALTDETFIKLMPIIDYITINLNTPSITQIARVDSGASCPPGFSPEKLTSWPGSLEGCFCPGKYQVSQGKCTAEDLNIGCYKVPSLDSQILWSWNHDDYCIKRLKNHYIKPLKTSCSKNYIDCGRMCVQNTESCPITNLSLVETASIDQNNAAIEKIDLSDGRSLIISRDLASQPIYTLETSFHDKPCLEPAYIPAIAEGNYPLLNIPTHTGCGEYGIDESSIVLESLNMTKLFEQNALTTVEKLPLYLERENTAEAYLVARPRFAVSTSDFCQSLDFRSLGILNDLIASFKKFVIGGTIFPLIAVIGFWVFLMYLLFDQGSRKFPKKATKKWVPWAIFSACFIILMIYCHSLSDENDEILNQQSFYAYLGSTNCFENQEISNALASFSKHIPTGASSIMGYGDTIFWVSIIFYFGAVAVKGYHLASTYYNG